jgi:hypothetical protein
MALARFNNSIQEANALVQNASASAQNFKATLAAAKTIQNKLAAANSQIDDTFTAQERAAAVTNLNNVGQAQTNFLTSRINLIPDVASFLEVVRTLPTNRITEFITQNQQAVVKNESDLWNIVKVMPDNSARGAILDTPTNQALVQNAISKLATRNYTELLENIAEVTSLVAHLQDPVTQHRSLQRAMDIIAVKIHEFPAGSFNPLISVMNSLPEEITGLNNQHIRAKFIEANLGLIRESREVPTLLQLLPADDHVVFLRSVQDKINTSTDVANIMKQLNADAGNEFLAEITQIKPSIMSAHAVSEAQAAHEDLREEIITNDVIGNDEIVVSSNIAESKAVELEFIEGIDSPQAIVELAEVQQVELLIDENEFMSFEFDAPEVDNIEDDTLANDNSNTTALEAESAKVNEGPKRR